MSSSPIGIYIHIPFCKSKCPYCDFHSGIADESTKDSYVKALKRAILQYPEDILADSVYFGGGTPTLLGERLCEVLSLINTTDDAEITVEANPKTVDLAMLTALVKGGFNRISFGVQSTDDSILKTLGRVHNAEQAAEAILMAKTAGFEHISADLMLCVPNQTTQQVTKDIETLAKLPIDHISAYLLKIEEGTPFFGRYSDINEDNAADCYLQAVADCERLGFFQYEISNFARDKKSQSLHNTKYWTGKNYLGIGASAHSMMDNKRFYFPSDTQMFCEQENVFNVTVEDGDANSPEERIMLGLRLCEGIPLELILEVGEPALKKAEEIADNGLATIENGRFALTREGFLISNTIISKIIF